MPSQSVIGGTCHKYARVAWGQLPYREQDRPRRGEGNGSDDHEQQPSVHPEEDQSGMARGAESWLPGIGLNHSCRIIGSLCSMCINILIRGLLRLERP
jgi:hypothetical protein